MVITMKILFKVVLAPDTIVNRVIENVDYISVGKRSISYRLKDKEQWIHTLRFDSVSHIRILEDGSKNEN